MLGWITKFREFWNDVDKELEAMYAERDKNVEMLARHKAGYNRRDRRHLEGFTSATKHKLNVKMYNTYR